MASKFEEFILSEAICHEGLDMAMSVSEYALDMIVPVDEAAILEEVELEEQEDLEAEEREISEGVVEQDKHLSEMIDENGCLDMHTLEGEVQKVPFITEATTTAVPLFTNEFFVKLAKGSKYDKCKKTMAVGVAKCKTVDASKVLDKDLTMLLNYLKEKEIMTTSVVMNKQLNEYMTWLKTEARKLIKDKRDDLKTAGVQESFVAKLYKYDREHQTMLEQVAILQESDKEEIFAEGYDFDTLTHVFECNHSTNVEDGIKTLTEAVSGMTLDQLAKFKATIGDKVMKLTLEAAKEDHNKTTSALLEFYTNQAEGLVDQREKRIKIITEALELGVDVKDAGAETLTESSIDLINSISSADTIQDMLSMELRQREADEERRMPEPEVEVEEPVAAPALEEPEVEEPVAAPALEEPEVEEPVEESCKDKKCVKEEDSVKTTSDEFEDYKPEDKDNDGVDDADVVEECTGEDDCKCKDCVADRERRAKAKAKKSK